MPARVDRIAVVVDDLDTVTRDLHQVFGMTFTVLHVASMELRVAISEAGLELVEKTTAARVPIERIWRGPIASIEIRVEDVDDAILRLRAGGLEPDHSLVTPGGVPKVQLGTSMLGAPALVYSVPEGVSYVEGVTGRSGDGDVDDYSPEFDRRL